MRVCLIATEIFDHGIYGGFGALTREIARGLSNKGLEVYVLVPRKPSQKPVEIIDNFTVVSYPSNSYVDIRRSLRYESLFEMIDADIYHSQEPSVGTYLAQKAVPRKKHIVTFQDPRTFEDRKREWIGAGLDEIAVWKCAVEFSSFHLEIKKVVRNADALFCQAWYSTPKVMKLYGLRKTPEFLPNPVIFPTRKIKKSDKPTVCFLARWDPRKRPEFFFELAGKCPDVKFIAMGACQPRFAQRDKILREKYKNLPNLTMTGWCFGEDKSKILEQSWILINTSWRECLPVSYLEAAAHKCAILSHENPDDFAGNFGYHAKNGSLEDFETGLNWLLGNNRWRNLGKKGWAHVKEIYEFSKTIARHIEVYREVLES